MLQNAAMASSENEGLKICGIRRKPEFSSPSGFEAFRNGGALGVAVRFPAAFLNRSRLGGRVTWRMAIQFDARAFSAKVDPLSLKMH
jgi:hypothetical protein